MVSFGLGIISFVLIITLIILDIKKKISLTNRYIMGVYLLVMPHILSLVYYDLRLNPSPAIWFWDMVILFAYIFIKIMIHPNRRRGVTSKRLHIMEGGRWLLIYTFFCQAIQIALYRVLIFKCGVGYSPLMYYDFIVTLIFMWLLGINGILRIICTSSWLSVFKRISCIILLHIPIVAFFVMVYLGKTARLEFEYFSYKKLQEKHRANSDICATKYPIVMVHGVGFRDLHYFNYWGRIPQELEKLGAKIYYGHQEGWGTIINNAEELKTTILDVLKETGAKKVNIIAHSKGGLDSRYAISQLGMGEYVASLTTVSTPHHGVKMADVLVHMPQPLFKFINFCVNSSFKGYGDKNPNFAEAAYDFTTQRAKQFNQLCKDVPSVYYQSYTSVIKNVFSDYVLRLPYIFISIIDGPNDGLVTVDSAKWGNFRGVIKNKYTRGISHADVIDLKRENFRGFDVVEKYISIVSELKDRGY